VRLAGLPTKQSGGRTSSDQSHTNAEIVKADHGTFATFQETEYYARLNGQRQRGGNLEAKKPENLSCPLHSAANRNPRDIYTRTQRFATGNVQLSIPPWIFYSLIMGWEQWNGKSV
jgi:hypothetical protein